MNRILLKIGTINIYWYSIILLVAFIIGGILVFIKAKKENIKKELVEDFLFYLIPICLVGARIYYVLFNMDYYSKYPGDIIKVWEGGLAIHGGILFGLLYLIYFCKKNKIEILKMTDILVISLMIGQIIGRWGNFMNQEAYGPIVSLKWLKSFHIPNFIISNMYIDGAYHHPTFLYESLWNLVGLIIIVFITKIIKNRKGLKTSLYLIWYGIGRFLIESLRTDSLMIFNIKIAQIISSIFILSGILILIITRKRKNNSS